MKRNCIFSLEVFIPGGVALLKQEGTVQLSAMLSDAHLLGLLLS